MPKFRHLFSLWLAAMLSMGVATSCKEETRLLPQICTVGEILCNEDGTANICAADGRHWVQSSCADGETCANVKCGTHTFTDACVPIICAPGNHRCNPDDNVRIELCDERGIAWCCTGSCAVPQIDGVCFDGQCVAVCAAGEKSYLGCDYFAVDLDNAYVPCGTDDNGNLIHCDAAGSQFAVVLSNPDTGREAVYQVSNGPPPELSLAEQCQPPPHVVAAGVLPPKGLAIVELPRRDVNGTVKAQLAYRIASNAPITAYQFNPLENVDVFSNDASLLLPTNTAGTQYYVMTREQTFDDLKGYLTVVGIDNEVANVSVFPTARTLSGPGIPALDPGDLFHTTLHRFEVLNIETNRIGDDLTGSLVLSDIPVVVFGGSEAANTPNTSRCNLDSFKCEWDGETDCECKAADGPACNPHAKCSSFITCCADHLEQQMFPLSTWGTEYLAIRSMPRGTAEHPGQEKDAWRIMAGYDNTQVSLAPAFATIPTLSAGEWFEVETDEDFLIVSNEPILVGQFLAAEQAPNPGVQDGDAGIGDPAFILVAPTRQFRDSYVFLAPNKYAEDYVSIGAPLGTVPELDGVPLNQLDPNQVRLQTNEIIGTPWRAYRLHITDGFHILTCTGTTCSIMVHGYDSYVSYGYPGGLNLEDEEVEL